MVACFAIHRSTQQISNVRGNFSSSCDGADCRQRLVRRCVCVCGRSISAGTRTHPRHRELHSETRYIQQRKNHRTPCQRHVTNDFEICLVISASRALACRTRTGPGGDVRSKHTGHCRSSIFFSSANGMALEGLYVVLRRSRAQQQNAHIHRHRVAGERWCQPTCDECDTLSSVTVWLAWPPSTAANASSAMRSIVAEL